MVNDSRIVMRNDFRGPGNRPLLRLSRFGGGGVFFVPGNQLGYATAVHPSGRTQPFLDNVQGKFQRHEQIAVTSPIPGSDVKGDARGLGFRMSPYAPQPKPVTSRQGFFARRATKTCPTCGR